MNWVHIMVTFAVAVLFFFIGASWFMIAMVKGWNR